MADSDKKVCNFLYLAVQHIAIVGLTHLPNLSETDNDLPDPNRKDA